MKRHGTGLRSLRLQVGELRAVETRTRLHRVKHVMADNQRMRIVTMQLLQKPSQGCALLRSPGVVRTSLHVQSPLVAHPDAVTVMVHAVRPHPFRRSSLLHRAVASHHIVIAYSRPPSGPVPTVDVGGTALLPRTDSGAMNNNQRNRSHNHTTLSPQH